MQFISVRVWALLKIILGLVLFVPFAFLILLMFLGGPIAILAETYDLICFDGRTTGKLTSLEIVYGSKGTSATVVSYVYNSNGKDLISNRLYPGFAANYGTYTGGASLAKKYTVGQQVQVYFDSSNPVRACLEHGWHKWSIAWTVLIWGMVGYPYFLIKKSRLWILAVTLVVYGFGLLAIGPNTVFASELHWHLLAVLGCSTAVMVYASAKSRTTRQRDTRQTIKNSGSTGQEIS